MIQKAASTIGRRYGWRADLPGMAKPVFSVPEARLLSLPPSADLRGVMPSVYDQLNLGACTSQAIAAAIHSNQLQQKFPSPFIPSRLMIYYLERAYENTINSDAGAAISDGLRAVHEYGYCDEALWPYHINDFAKKPPQSAFDAAKVNVIVDYAAVLHSPAQIRGVLAGGDPVVFGFTVFESFESNAVAQTGIVPLPKSNEQVLGGHAVLAVGYDDVKQQYLVRNSWGSGWGLSGYCWMPYSFVHSQYASDFWVVNKIPNSQPVPPTPPDPTPVPPIVGKKRLLVDLDAQTATVAYYG